MAEKHIEKPYIVIVGSGFGGLACARGLQHADAEITLLDHHNYHLFQPLLYQVATASLSSTDIALPIRHIFNTQKNIRVFMEEVTDIDTNKQCVKTYNNNIYSYDYLVLATGSQHTYFNHPEWEKFAPSLKDIKDALLLREKILFSFEQAEITKDPIEREAYLTFVIIGAGPTGVEMAGALHELARLSLARDFKVINPTKARIILIEAGPKILNSFPDKLSHAAYLDLKKLGVQVYTQKKVTDINENEVVLNTEIIKTKTVIWAAGVKASPAAAWIKCQTDRSGRIIVNADLSVPEFPTIYALGDTCAYKNEKNNYLPGIASVAKQQGNYLAHALCKKLKGKMIKNFHYKNYGNLAAIGRKYAIADFNFLQLEGFFSYVLWWVVHIYYLVGFKNRIAVTLKWLWSAITFNRGDRIIIDKAKKTKSI